MRTVISVSPFLCRMWAFHDRLDDNITEQTCRNEIESFLRKGQLLPVLARPIRDDTQYRFELIFGARRLFVARHLNMPLLAEVQDISDRDAIVAMDIENRHRLDVSHYERGLGYAKWLNSGLFKSQEDISRSLKVSTSQVSRLLKLAQLPAVIIDAFGSPTQICERWGLDLMEVLEDSGRRQRTVKVARELQAQSRRPSPREVYRTLLSASSAGRKFVGRSMTK